MRRADIYPRCSDGSVKEREVFTELDDQLSAKGNRINMYNPAVRRAAMVCSRCALRGACQLDVSRWIMDKDTELMHVDAPNVVGGLLLKLTKRGVASAEKIDIPEMRWRSWQNGRDIAWQSDGKHFSLGMEGEISEDSLPNFEMTIDGIGFPLSVDEAGIVACLATAGPVPFSRDMIMNSRYWDADYRDEVEQIGDFIRAMAGIRSLLGEQITIRSDAKRTYALSLVA